MSAVPLEDMSTQIRERQEASRLHREEMHELSLVKAAAYAGKRRAAAPIPSASGATCLCACGCGEEVNPRLRLFRALVERGYTHQRIATEVGVTRNYVSLLLRNPPRYIRGHYRKGQLGPRPVRNCDNCGEPYKQMGPGQLCCRKPSCHWIDHTRRILDPWNETQERKAAAKERRKGQLSVIALISRRTDPEWLEAERVRAMDDPELAPLIAAQDKDTCYEFRVPEWETISLDADRMVRQKLNEDGYDYTLYAFVPDPQADTERALDAQRLWEIVGDMHPDDVARMDEHSLARLQDRLRVEGFGAGGVTSGERERLRQPDVHSGGKIVKAKSRPGKQKRRERIAHTAAKQAHRGGKHRPKQKARKRWTRETPKDVW